MSHAKSICPRQSARLSQKRHDRRIADCLVPDSQPEQKEPLVVIPPTTTPGFIPILELKRMTLRHQHVRYSFPFSTDGEYDQLETEVQRVMNNSLTWISSCQCAFRGLAFSIYYDLVLKLYFI